MAPRVSEGQFSTLVSGTQNGVWLELIPNAEKPREWPPVVPESSPTRQV